VLIDACGDGGGRRERVEPLPIGRRTPETEAVAIVKEWAACDPDEGTKPLAAAAQLRTVRPRRLRGLVPDPRPRLAGLMWPWYGGLAIGSQLRDRRRARRSTSVDSTSSLTAVRRSCLGYRRAEGRFLPPIVRNDEVWCQLFPSPAPAPTLVARRARPTRRRWAVTGQKVWSTWAAADTDAHRPHRSRPAEAQGHHVLPAPDASAPSRSGR
jgi:hypothetical protein